MTSAIPDPAQAGGLQAAIALHVAGQLQQAQAMYLALLQQEPQHPDANHNLGVIALQTGQPEASLDWLKRALQVNPAQEQFWLSYHDALLRCRHDAAALQLYTAALQRGLSEAALQKLALRQEQNDPVANHGPAGQSTVPSPRDVAAISAHFEHGRLAQAHAKACLMTLRHPDAEFGWRALGTVLQQAGRHTLAVQALRRAVALNPGEPQGHTNLGIALNKLRQFDEAEASFRQALAIDPNFSDARSNLLFSLNYHPDKPAEEIYAAYAEYDRRYGQPLRAGWQPHHNPRGAGRRLNVGYLSSDFHAHSSHFFLEPLLARHDKSAVRVVAYSQGAKEDATTQRYRTYVDQWVPVRALSNAALAQRVRDDGIDVLVDLTGHSGDSRLLAFAHKPAPVSLSWLGFGTTTGLSAIDYYLTDDCIVPPGAEAFFSEQPWRLARPAFVYRPPAGTGEPDPSPAALTGGVTFGTLTRSMRISPRTVRVWARLLHAVPKSRLLVDSRDFRDSEMRELLLQQFAGHGIVRERLEVGFHSPPWDVLRATDITLDCFPHNSGTTLFESLYMGVPFVTLAGRAGVGRLGSSILHGVRHPEWIAVDEDDYVAKAAALASDLPALAAVRATLRQRMQASPLMDEAGFARAVEAAYRAMFARWAA